MLTGGGEGILGGELPHACDELRKAANEEGHADDDVRRGDAPGLDVVHGEDEGGGGEASDSCVRSSSRRRLEDQQDGTETTYQH